MATILNSVHLDCSWETSYSQPFVPTWSAMLHVPQGNAKHGYKDDDAGDVHCCFALSLLQKE